MQFLLSLCINFLLDVVHFVIGMNLDYYIESYIESLVMNLICLT